MKLNRETATGILLVSAYDEHSFTINGETHASSLVLMPDFVEAWPPAIFSEIGPENFLRVCELKPALVLIGTGTRQRFPVPANLRPLIEARIGFEIMDSGSACRTYNLLASEGRRVAAMLLLES